MKEQVIFNARMQIAALKQLLRDLGEEMSETDRDLILDQISRLIKVIAELEK